MDTPAAAKPAKINRWLPYWAVLQADVRQTTASWVYRTWVFVSLLAALGYLMYQVGVYRGAKIIEPTANMISDLLRWTVLGSVTLIIILAAGTISAERGTVADAVLSRGISRYQYFLGKWHSRLVTVLITFVLMSGLTLLGAFFLLHEDLSLSGSLVALAMVSAILAAVVSCGVTVSAVAPNTMLAIASLWMIIHGLGFGAYLLPEPFLSPDRLLKNLPSILRGYYNLDDLGRVVTVSACVSVVVAGIGMICFARRDV